MRASLRQFQPLERLDDAGIQLHTRALCPKPLHAKERIFNLPSPWQASNAYAVDDFYIVRGERSLHILNAPSPAATASIAIGRTLAAQLDELVTA